MVIAPRASPLLVREDALDVVRADRVDDRGEPVGSVPDAGDARIHRSGLAHCGMRRSVPLKVAMVGLVAAAVMAGCASDDAAEEPAAATSENVASSSAERPSPTSITTRTASPATLAPASTTPTTTTTTTTTTPLTTPATAPVLPVPIDAASVESAAREPLIEIGTIEIPAVGLSRPMFEGVQLATLDNGPGHWPGTAMPGEVGNVVVAGHRVSRNQDFRNLDKLAPGDEVIMSTMSGRHVYRVLSTEIVLPNAIWIVDQTPARTATLFACHPPGSVRERIVVHLELAT